MLNSGPHCLGRATAEFIGYSKYPVDKKDPLYLRNARAMYDFVAREMEAGRPCVIWGTYVPEFGVAVGAADNHYHVKCFREVIGEEQPPIRFDELDLVAVHYALAFPGETHMSQLWADRGAVFRAARLLTQLGDEWNYTWGHACYQTWIAALEADKAQSFGNAYNAQCWHEAKRFAGEFLKRVAGRHEVAAEPLHESAGQFVATAQALERVAKLFPFPPGEEPPSEKTRSEAVKHLREAEAAEEKAIAALLDARNAPWPLK